MIKGYPTKEHMTDFFQTLARTILLWNTVETELFSVYLCLLNTKEGPNISAAYYSIHNVHVHLKMVDAAAQVTLRKSILLLKWNNIYKKIIKHVKQRNNLVHLNLHPNIGKDGLVTLELHQSYMNVNAKKTRYDINKIKEIYASFDSLGTDLKNLYLQLYKFNG